MRLILRIKALNLCPHCPAFALTDRSGLAEVSRLALDKVGVLAAVDGGVVVDLLAVAHGVGRRVVDARLVAAAVQGPAHGDRVRLGAEDAS